MPIYFVKTPTDEHIVEASSKAVAINHVVQSTITAKNLNATDLMDYVRRGFTVEQANSGQPATNDPKQATNGEKTL